jgi:hypothetical protein
MILPLLTTTAVVLLPEQVVPVLTTIHAPSNKRGSLGRSNGNAVSQRP